MGWGLRRLLSVQLLHAGSVCHCRSVVGLCAPHQPQHAAVQLSRRVEATGAGST